MKSVEAMHNIEPVCFVGILWIIHFKMLCLWRVYCDIHLLHLIVMYKCMGLLYVILLLLIDFVVVVVVVSIELSNLVLGKLCQLVLVYGGSRMRSFRGGSLWNILDRKLLYLRHRGLLRGSEWSFSYHCIMVVKFMFLCR